MNQRLLLFLVFCLFHAGYWRPYAIFTDEKASVFLSNGIPTDNFSEHGGFMAPAYDSISSAEIAEGNKLVNVLRFAVRDGGNGLLYYSVAHYVSITLGPLIGVFNALKLFSCICSLIMILVFYQLARSLTSSHNALIASVLLIALSVRFNIFIRNYAMSNMMVMLFLAQVCQYYRSLRDAAPSRRSKLLWLIPTAIALPFVHFFNVVFIGLAAIPGFIGLLNRTNIRKHIAFIACLTPALIIFAIYYVLINQDGRAYQSLINQYWKTYAGMYGYGSNYWLAPFSFKYAAIENSELLLRLFGLDLRDSLRFARLIWILPLLTLPIYVIYRLLAKKEDSGSVLNSWFPRFSGLIFLFYLLLMNAVYYFSGHATALNSQWYFSPLFLIVAFIILIALSTFGQGRLRKILIIYIFIVVINSVIGGFSTVNRDVPTDRITALMLKIEGQFR